MYPFGINGLTLVCILLAQGYYNSELGTGGNFTFFYHSKQYFLHHLTSEFDWWLAILIGPTEKYLIREGPMGQGPFQLITDFRKSVSHSLPCPLSVSPLLPPLPLPLPIPPPPSLPLTFPRAEVLYKTHY